MKMFDAQLVIPLAGEGKRFRDKYSCPKPLIGVRGEKMISLAFRTLDIPHSNAVFIIRQDHDENGDLTNAIRSFSPLSSIVVIDKLTEGPCSTALLAAPYLNPDKPLVIANCDQVMRWNGLRFIRYCKMEDYDGVVVTYHEATPKNSYARLNANGDVVEIREKKQISCVSLNGIHYWKRAKYFFDSSNQMIYNNDRTNNEFYIAPSYNYMIEQGMRVGIFHIPNEQHHPIGTTQDLETYIDRTQHEI
jgi:bifunctional N-acetylglucosamine-1-phosphate-uridyltransferase/glucosamine-1-phosphate-acetyltransferase GlmU-like protein